MGGQSHDSLILPLIVGLVTGVGFLIIFSYSIGNLPITREYWERPSQFNEFDVPDQLAEVKFLKEKYSSDALGGFSRSEGKTIQFYYVIAGSIDVDGNGYKETPRRLTLTLTYDESEGLIENNPDAKLLGAKIQCTEPSSSDIRTFVDVVPPAEDGQIMNFIQNTKCMF